VAPRRARKQGRGCDDDQQAEQLLGRGHVGIEDVERCDTDEDEGVKSLRIPSRTSAARLVSFPFKFPLAAFGVRLSRVHYRRGAPGSSGPVFGTVTRATASEESAAW